MTGRSNFFAACVVFCGGLPVAACEEQGSAVEAGALFEVLLPAIPVWSVRITAEGKVLVAAGSVAADDLYCANLSRNPESGSLMIFGHGCERATSSRDDPLQMARNHWEACGWVVSSFPTAAEGWDQGSIIVESRAAKPPHTSRVQLIETNSCNEPRILNESSGSLACAMPAQRKVIVAAYSDALAPAWFELVEIEPEESGDERVRKLDLELSGEGGAACTTSGEIVAIGYPIEHDHLAELQLLCRTSVLGRSGVKTSNCSRFPVKDSYEALDIALSIDGYAVATVVNTPTASGIRLKLTVAELSHGGTAPDGQ